MNLEDMSMSVASTDIERTNYFFNGDRGREEPQKDAAELQSPLNQKTRLTAATV